MSERVAIEIRGLVKQYGEHRAVDGIDIEVRTGEIFALLGPNGAGKTTTLEVLEGYRQRDAGTISVLGVDPAHPTLEWRNRIGLVLQESQMPAELTARELVTRYAGYYQRPRDVAATIELVGLSDKADARSGSLSGGQRRRLDVALALIGDPDLVFLDEPTTGFDPAARRASWSMIAALRDLGKTIVLTTHYMEEAEALADRLAIIVAGRVVAAGTPETIGGRDRAPATITFSSPVAPSLDGTTVNREGDQVSVETTDVTTVLSELIAWSDAGGGTLAALEVRRPTLEDIYLSLAETPT
ncbi:MAG: ABC transporter ATP-binding protein [Microthrixaceae bacterium]